MAKFILKKVLREKGITQYRLAKMLGMSPGEVYRLCKEGHDPRLSTMAKIAEALEINIGDLVS